MAPRSSYFEAGSSLPRNLRARLLRRMLDALLQTPLQHPRRGRGFYNRGGRHRSGNAAAWRAANSSNSSTNANHRGNSMVLHGEPVMVITFYPRHGRSIYPCGNDGSSLPEYTPATPPTSPPPAPPPELLLRGMIAARRDAPFFSMTTGSAAPAGLLQRCRLHFHGRPTRLPAARPQQRRQPSAPSPFRPHQWWPPRAPAPARPLQRWPTPVLPTATALSRPGIARPRRAATAWQDAPHP